LNEAKALRQLAVLSAPISGRVESLLVSAGQVVSTGATVARIVPEGDVTRAVVFVPSREAAFVTEGLSANLEFPSLPVSDFGRAHAHVERVGHDVASAAEVADVLEGAAPGADAVVRVELVIDDDETWRQMSPRLRSGARVTARIMTRERRILSLALDFLKQWVPE
jgi:multidrug efflux pump subunit AcrA (membrane-fusion protein)